MASQSTDATSPSSTRAIASPPINPLQLARVTKKVMDRLAPFCGIQPLADHDHCSTVDLHCSRSTSRFGGSESSASPFGSPFSSPSITPSPSISGLNIQNRTRSGSGSGSLSLEQSGSHTPPLTQAPHTTSGSPHTPPPGTGSKTPIRAVVSKLRSRVAKLIDALDVHMKSCCAAYELCNEALDGLKASEPSSSNNLANEASDRVNLNEEGLDGVNEAPESKSNEQEKQVLLRKYASTSLKLVQQTEKVFRDVRQSVYKIAAQTKETSTTSNPAYVLVPPGPGQPPTLRKPLKEISMDLVANLGLFQEFTRMVEESVGWWGWVLGDLQSEVIVEGEKNRQDNEEEGREREDAQGEKNNEKRNVKSLLYPSRSNVLVTEHAREWWTKQREEWQTYRDIISALHDQYTALLPHSTRAMNGEIFDTPANERSHDDEDEEIETPEGYIRVSRRSPVHPGAQSSSPSGARTLLRRLSSPKRFRSMSQSTSKGERPAQRGSSMSLKNLVVGDGERDSRDPDLKLKGFLMCGTGSDSGIGIGKTTATQRGDGAKRSKSWVRRGQQSTTEGSDGGEVQDGKPQVKRSKSLWTRRGGTQSKDVHVSA
ncbi:hypothetical protein CC2G_014490 [Coprinopsis cinerea AmutBmut pab1-1]|nr:hypothetical protein CC2G_014490 [Coprinopsis cinerea AmutBmut pab1-1]